MSNFIRKNNTIKPFKVIRIYTEGKKTEPNYFNAIRDELHLSQINIVIRGCGDHTSHLVKWVIERKNEIKNTDEESEWWVVFDRDYHEGFEEAINLALNNGIQVAYSNECFELWFILHFEFLCTSIGRKNFEPKLTKLLGKKYEKSMDVYSLIKNRESKAIQNAKNLEKEHILSGVTSPLKMDPSTNVYKLVERLRLFKKEIDLLIKNEIN